jgi:signal peptide peptidase SppA
MNVPLLSQYFGYWAMHEEEFLAQHSILMGIDLHVHMQGPDPERARQQSEEYGRLQVRDGIAEIVLNGSLLKYQSSAMESTSTKLAKKLADQARINTDVLAVMLYIDSPGGTVAGLQPLVAAVAQLASEKPTIAFVENMCASAAYRVACQANKIVASQDSLIGSIGTYGVIHDMSAAATMKGVKVHVVKAGAHKAAGVPGTEVTADMLTDRQRTVNEFNESFIRDVATGRGLSIEATRELADGRVHIASKAQTMRLIDGVQSLDQTWTKLVALTQQRRKSA